MIGIVNYRVGNMHNLRNALTANGIQSTVVDTPDALDRMDKLILPGVGAFSYAIKNLRKYGFEEPLKALAGKMDILGICVGMQLLFSESFEQSVHKGLDIIPGRVKKLNVPLKIPHMGWNKLRVNPQNPIFSGMPKEFWVYYVHSFSCDPINADVTVGTTQYGGNFTGAVRQGRVYGFQFHPERSHDRGLQLLKNFNNL